MQIDAQTTVHWWQSRWRETRKEQAGFSLVLVDHAPMVYNRLLHRLQRRTLLRTLARVGPLTGRRVLDVGCGIGRWVREWRGLGAEPVGIDLSESLLRRNQNRDGASARYATMSAQQLAFKTDSFDLVTCVTVLQHIPFSAQPFAVQEIVRCVRPGGWVLIHEHVRKLYDPTLQDSTTFSNSPEEWARMFASAGCRLVHSERYPLLPLFSAYWRSRNHILEHTRKARGSSSNGGSPGAAPTQERMLKPVYRHGNRAAYWVLSWLSGPVERVVDCVPRLKTRALRSGMGAHSTFLFRKEGTTITDAADQRSGT